MSSELYIKFIGNSNARPPTINYQLRLAIYLSLEVRIEVYFC